MSHAACRSAWARLITKVYEINPLVCPRCGSEMSLIAVITDPAEVRTILRHPRGGALRRMLKIGSALGIDQLITHRERTTATESV